LSAIACFRQSAGTWSYNGVVVKKVVKSVRKPGSDLENRVEKRFGVLPNIFRLVQESLTNIHRHSGSKTALIRIERDENAVRVQVEDHGKGMSPERLAEIQSQGTGVGIRGMRERLRHFRGDLVIESDGSGTKVNATVPLRTALSTHRSNTRQEVA